MNPIECRGIWWTPEKPSSRVAGTLRFSNKEGLVLSLLGTLGEPISPFGAKTLPLILGQSYDGRPGVSSITLKNCRWNGYTVGLPGFSKEDYQAERAFLGAHLITPTDFLFSNCNMSTSSLSGWTHHLSGFQLTQPEGPIGTGVWYTLSYAPPPSFEANIPGAHVVLYFGAGYSQKTREFNFKEEVSFSISSESPLSEEEWRRYVYGVFHFITFATDTPNTLQKLTFSRRPDERPYASVEVVESRTENVAEDDGGPAPHRMLFSLQHLGDRFGAVVERWFQTISQFPDACSVFFATQYGPGTYTEARLLMLMQALDLYQWKRNKSPGDQGTTLPAAFPEMMLKAWPEWLASPPIDPFTSTLAELFEEHRDLLGPLVVMNKADFMNVALALRMYVVHRIPDPARIPEFNASIYLFTEILAVLMKACLLKELGFNTEERKAIFQQHIMYGFLSREYKKLAILWKK